MVCTRVSGGFAVLNWEERKWKGERESKPTIAASSTRNGSGRTPAIRSAKLARIEMKKIELKLFDYDQRPDWLAIGDESSESAMA